MYNALALSLMLGSEQDSISLARTNRTNIRAEVLLGKTHYICCDRHMIHNKQDDSQSAIYSIGMLHIIGHSICYMIGKTESMQFSHI